MYNFNKTTLEIIQKAFLSTTLEPEQVEFSCIEKRDYLFIKFDTPVVFFANHGEQTILPIILAGDIELTKSCNQLLQPLGGIVDMSFRWFSSYQDQKSITATGYALKIIYPNSKSQARADILINVFQELEKARFIQNATEYKNRILSELPSIPETTRVSPPPPQRFFQTQQRSRIAPHQLDVVKMFIHENIPPVTAHYVRANELSINPTYQNSEMIKQGLTVHQKKIWLLRSDFILALGNKNLNWTYFNEDGLHNAVDPKLHAFVNWEDRYGHPSLAPHHPGYNGSAYYGGYLAQRPGCLELYTFCGRYHRNDLDEHRKAVLEAYIAHHLQMAYGEQPVVFMDAIISGSQSNDLDPFELSLFLNNKSLPEYCTRRAYHRENIGSIFEKINNVANKSIGSSGGA